MTNDNPPVAAAPVAGAGASAELMALDKALTPVLDAVAPWIERPRPGVRITLVHPVNEAVAAQVVDLARRYPALASAGDPANIEAGLATLAAARTVSQHLDVARREIDDTGRMAFAGGWKTVRQILDHAEILAKDDKTLTEELATILAPLRRESPTAAAERVAAKAAEKLARAQSNLAKAQQKAATTSEAAAAMATAHAARHPAPAEGVIAPVAPPQNTPTR